MVNKIVFNRIFVLILILINIELCLSSPFYVETENDINERLNFYNKYHKLVSRDQIIFEYSKEGGIICKAKKDIPLRQNHLIFTIPKEFVISGSKIT